MIVYGIECRNGTRYLYYRISGFLISGKILVKIWIQYTDENFISIIFFIHIPEHCLFIFHSLSMSSCPCSSPHFYKLTPNHLHSYDPYAQTISIYHASPPQARSENTKKTLQDLTSLNSYPSEILCTSIICSVLSRQCRFSAFIAHVSLSYVNTLWNIFPF